MKTKGLLPCYLPAVTRPAGPSARLKLKLRAAEAGGIS